MTILILVFIIFLLRKQIFTIFFSAASAVGMDESDLESGRKMSDKLFEDQIFELRTLRGSLFFSLCFCRNKPTHIQGRLVPKMEGCTRHVLYVYTYPKNELYGITVSLCQFIELPRLVQVLDHLRVYVRQNIDYVKAFVTPE